MSDYSEGHGDGVRYERERIVEALREQENNFEDPAYWTFLELIADKIEAGLL
jgi:hypothetical protein